MATAEEVFGRDIEHRRDFTRDQGTGDINSDAGRTNVENALFRRLMTVPGTLVHRPNYGVGVKEFQNSLHTLDARRKLANRIDNQFPLDDRVQKVNGVAFSTTDDKPDKITITVRVQLVGLGEISIEFTPFEESNPI